MFRVNFCQIESTFQSDFHAFSRNRQTKKIKLSAHGKTKSKHNWIGLEAGGEKKTTTRSNQKCKCATISKCAQNAFNGYKNRQRQQQRQGPRAAEERRVASGRLWAVATDKFGSFGYFYTYILVVHPKSVGSCLHLSAHTSWLGPQQMPWQSRFLICMENCLRAAPPSPPWLLFIPFCAVSLPPFGAGNWRVAAATHRQRERERVQHSVLHPHLCYKCNCCYSPPPVTLPPSFNANAGRPVGRIGAEGICFTYLTN